MLSETNKRKFLLIISGTIILLSFISAFFPAGRRLVEDWLYFETVEVTIVRREKAKLQSDIDPQFLFADDLDRPDAFYVKTVARGWFKTDIDTFDDIGRGRAIIEITKRNGTPVIVGKKDGLK